jgi:AcrR family transcriptional regulator
MSELRKKQREKRATAIIKAAMELISEKGYRNTSIEEIAAKAEVGPATVYNYFGSKSGLIISVFTDIKDIMIKKGEKLLSNLPDTPEEAVYKIAASYFGDMARRYDKKLMREVYVAIMIEQLSVRKEMMQMDYAVMEHVVKLLEIFKARGQLAKDINMLDMGFVLYSIILTDLTALFMDDDMTVRQFLEAMKRHIYLSFRGFKP